MFSKLILDREFDALSERGKHYLERLDKSVHRMQNLIKDLIMYTKVKVQKQLFQNLPFRNIIEGVMQELSEEISQKKAVIEVGEMCAVRVIPFQLRQLLENLIGNSIKFSRPGISPVISISCTEVKGDPEISETLVLEKNYSHITVSDNGIGFEQSFSDKIFEVFKRLHGKDEYEGTGIGLSIVKKIVENHEGVITASGIVNGGARFDIYLPQ